MFKNKSIQYTHTYININIYIYIFNKLNIHKIKSV